MAGSSPIEIVQAWFKAHIDSEKAQEFVTDDIVFHMPESGKWMSRNLPWGGRDSLRRLGILDRAFYRSYDQPSLANFHFMIEEGDWVLMQFDTKFDTWTGGKYHNYYVIAVRVAGDKIAEVFDLADTAYLDEAIFDSPEAKDGFFQRIDDMRAEMGAPANVW